VVYRTNVDEGVLKLFDQLDAAFPNRRTDSDGTIGDADHQDRTSDHNPQYPAPPGNPEGQIDAGDYTNDPSSGADMGVISESIRKSKDQRVKYVIFNRRIFYGPDYTSPFVWFSYTGTDPHTGHMHLSVRDATCNENYAWAISSGPVEEDDMRGKLLAWDQTPEKNLWAGDGFWRRKVDPTVFIWPWGPDSGSYRNAEDLIPGSYAWAPGKPSVEVNGPWDDATLDAILGFDIARVLTPAAPVLNVSGSGNATFTFSTEPGTA